MSEYAVIGWPLGHTLSPEIHNASFRTLGLKCRFAALPITPGNFQKFMESLPSSPLKGLAVTLPYKTEVLRYCARRSEEAEMIGAANTLCFHEKKILSAHNTDAAAAGRSLREAGVAPRGKRVVVLGAGGASRAICFQMLVEGAARLVIANRTLARAERLAHDLTESFAISNVSAVQLESDSMGESLQEADILINTTSVGMHPREGESPVRKELLKGSLAVLDIVYNPVETRLLREARELGARIIPGTEMFIHQAAEQEKIWLGVEAPIEAMRKALLTRLGKE